MVSNPLNPGTQRPVTNVLVATTAMLSFISLWRAAAIVLNDLGSSAFYAGAIAEQAIGQSAPWFILAVMLFAACVLLLYIESCSMFVRGGVYRVVKEAMGGKLAKMSVSALMFDYILTGPISGVSAGQYLVGFLNNAFASAHVHIVLSANETAAAFAILVTIYFWWQNVKGVPESSEKALRIMYITTVMVVLMLMWAGYTLWVRGIHLPPTPIPSHLTFAPTALGWLRWSRLPYTFGFIGILIGLGHSVLAMSGEETLAQVYREIEHPKLKNLKKAGVVIVLYSVIFTAGVSFLASMIIPNAVRPQFFANLISGLAMNFVGPYHLRLGFQAFVVLVGILMLSGAVNTAIVGANGVLSRVSEDGILPEWFRHPHPRYGTSHRIINLVTVLQVLAIILSRGNMFVLGEAYAFGVMWSFSMKGLAVLVLRFTEPEAREFKVPLNFKIGKTEIPLGLALITATLFSLSIINLFTKQVATISGVSFTIALFVVFTISEHYYHRRDASAGAELDQFNLAQENDLTPENVGVRPGNTLVPVSNYYALYHLHSALQRLKAGEQDVVVLHIRLLRRAASGEYGLRPDQLFSTIEQLLFTKVLAIAEKEGKPVRLAVAAANDVWDGIMRTAVNLQSSSIVVGSSSKMPVSQQAREVGLAWERLPEPRPRLNLDIFTPGGQEQIFYLGPHSPHLTPKEIDLLHNIWLQLSSELSGEELHHHDIVHFALTELEREMSQGQDGQVLERLRQHLREIKDRRPTIS
ncbi:MAG TPA: APC family permease [Candidatus Acidoferrales bacterium]|nr:APC family permease [Candidatus Acidoferrales bacterium]